MGGALQGLDAIASGMSLRLPVLAALSLTLTWPAAVRAESTWLDAVRMERWSDADMLAAVQPDPLARKLVLYFRLLAPGAGRAAELAAFMSDNPDWPGQTQLARRLADVMEPDGRSVRDLCQARAQASLPRCPGTVEDAVRLGSSAERARAAWVRGVEPAAEAAFLQQWSQALTADDHWRRFDRLAAVDTGALGSPAARQAARLDTTRRPVAEARLALRRDDPTAAVKLLGRVEPSLVFDLARWHRRAGRDNEAAQVWLTHGTAAEAAAPPDQRGPFWDERNLLTRRLLRFGQTATAYVLASGHAQAGETALDAEFLTGWIALRLGHPAVAARHFQVLAGQSKAAITQGRAQYWIGRAASAQEDSVGAAEAYAAAAAWPTTYYGQLAARALGDDDTALAARIAALQDPPFTAGQAQAVIARELARAAVLLVAWGEPRRAKAFLQRLDDTAGGAAERSAITRLTIALGMPEHAVALARRAGRDGIMLPDSGWPRPVSPPPLVERAVTLALMRQESSFDIEAGSPAGARGLMQLMPATAAAMARRLKEPADVPALTRDPAYNMRLGTTYLRTLLDQFGALPLALAGYNAGPSRVNDWIASNGDPRSGAVEMTDWIELIPFSETRNYVQRVLENVEIYRARQGAEMQVASGTE